MRRFVLTVLRGAGVLGLWRFLNRRRIVILTVHGVSAPADGPLWQPLRHRLSPLDLEHGLRILAKRYRFVSLDEAAAMLTGERPVEPYSIVLTFDDGYRNQIDLAGPVLRRYGIRPTVFVSTGHAVSRRPFWFDRLDYALQHGAVDGREVRIGPHAIRLEAGDRRRLARSYRRLRRLAKDVAWDDRQMCGEMEGLAAALEAESGRRLDEIMERDTWSAVLTPDEIRAAAGGTTFGSHTVDHLRLHRLDSDAIDDQLRRSKAAVESWTGRPCRFFCYPDGGHDAGAAAAVRRCGYDLAVTTMPGLNQPGDDVMRLRRIDVPLGSSEAELLAAVSGLTSWARDRSRGVRTTVTGLWRRAGVRRPLRRRPSPQAAAGRRSPV